MVLKHAYLLSLFSQGLEFKELFSILPIDTVFTFGVANILAWQDDKLSYVNIILKEELV